MSLLAFCRKCLRHPHHICFLGRLLTYPLFETHPQESRDLRVLLRPRRPRSLTLDFISIFGNAWGSLPMPRDVIRPRILLLYIQGVWKPWGTFSVITCCRNRCPIVFSKFLCVRSLSTSINFKFTKECTVSIITPAHYISIFLYSPFIISQ
jgi:hypothetical protein